MNSLLDQDTYKFSMQQAALKLYPRAQAVYRFKNRNENQPITSKMVDGIKESIARISERRLTDDEHKWMSDRFTYLYPWYLDWLRGFSPNPDHVIIRNDDFFELTIRGPWCETIYWEVPLLAAITSEIMKAQLPVLTEELLSLIKEEAIKKAKALALEGCRFAEFGTRRRFSYDVQDTILSVMDKSAGGCFLGTSNVHFAHKYGMKPIGTKAHEWVQAISALVGLRHANRFAMEAWNSVYKGDLGIALPDTFGTNAFLKDFDGVYARLYDGVRQDSGDPIEFMMKFVDHYKKLGIDPKSKTIIYSDSLNVGRCVLYKKASERNIKCAFGIGTNLTNDVPETTPANIVIKLVKMDGVPVVKLSDDPSKAIGDPKAIENAKWTFGIDS